MAADDSHPMPKADRRLAAGNGAAVRRKVAGMGSPAYASTDTYMTMLLLAQHTPHRLPSSGRR